MNAEEILKGPEFFWCNRLHARMKKFLCVFYQAVQPVNNPMVHYEEKTCCVKCKQGEVILKSVNIGDFLTAYAGKNFVFNKVETEKTCRKCGEKKELSELVRNESCKGGIDNYCRECNRKDQKRWREAKKLRQGA
jgi:hypothetical protein